MVCQQVASPGVGHLVRDDPREGAISGDERRRQKRQAWVFHAAVGEGRRQAQEVVLAPDVRLPSDLLGRLQEALHLGEFVRDFVNHARLRPDKRSRPDLARGEVADGDGEEVGGDGHRLMEGKDARARVGRLGGGSGRRAAPRTHQRGRPLGHRHARLVRELGAGRVLAGQQRAPMDCLTLCEEIRVLLPRSQLRRKPLTR
mmetsp:Transcript_1326/g.2603  ORF Transcript_1326/g.2603 Transcript_1326/m.2603 type:complete len:201 (+) Transcript_1326:835-1437(+)